MTLVFGKDGYGPSARRLLFGRSLYLEATINEGQEERVLATIACLKNDGCFQVEGAEISYLTGQQNAPDTLAVLLLWHTAQACREPKSGQIVAEIMPS